MSGDHMKALVLVEPGKTEVREIEKPSPGNGEVLLRIAKVGFCGGDLNGFRGLFPLQEYPTVLGHEMSAEIVEVGPSPLVIVHGAGSFGHQIVERNVAQAQLQIAEGLDEAHQRGVFHRDIKPNNIMFTADGTPKLTDFGLAAVPASTVAGTRGYMARSIVIAPLLT